MLHALLVLYAVATCTLTATKTQLSLQVTDSSGKSFTVPVQDVPLTATFIAGTEDVRVSVRGILSFEGTVWSEALPLRVVKEVTAAHGLVRLWPSNLSYRAIDNVRSAGKDLAVDLGGADEGRIHDVAIPCAAVTLDEQQGLPTRPPIPPLAKRQWKPRGQRLRIYRKPNPETSTEEFIELVFEKEPRFLAYGRSDGDWVHMRWEWREQYLPEKASVYAVDGWVRRSDLRSADSEFIGGAFGTGCHACSKITRHPDGPGTTRKRVRIKKNTEVRSAPDGGVWAIVDKEVPIDVWYREKESWAALVNLPEIDLPTTCPDREKNSTLPSDIMNAWVPRSAILE